jgi:hypothetical protein
MSPEVAQSRHIDTIFYLSAFGAKRTYTIQSTALAEPLLTDPVEKGLVNIDES